MVDRGELAGVQVGRQLRIAPAELERLLEEPRTSRKTDERPVRPDR
jgi:hypothetical protein